VFKHKCTSFWPLKKRPVVINCCIFRVRRKKYYQVSIIKGWHYIFPIQDESKFTGGRMINQCGIREILLGITCGKADFKIINKWQKRTTTGRWIPVFNSYLLGWVAQ
jgi:hypothetical protein